MAALRRLCGGSSTQVIIACGIVAETVGRCGDTTAIGRLCGIACQRRQRMDALEHVAIGGGEFRLPGVGLRLSHGGIAVVGQSTGGIAGCIVTLAGVGEVGTDAGLQFQLWDDSPLGKARADDTGILRLGLRVLQITDGVAHLTVVDVHTRRRRIVVERAVGIIYRGIGRVGDCGIPGTGGEHAATVVGHTVHLIVSGIGIQTHQEGLEHVTLIVDATRIARQIRTFHDTLLTLITTTDAVARNLVTTHGRELVLLLETCTEGSILPVVGGCGSIQTVADLTVLVEFVPDVCPLPGVEVVQFLANLTPSEAGVITDVVLAVRALLRGDDDHTVGTTCTIDSGGRDILQHLDALDV